MRNFEIVQGIACAMAAAIGFNPAHAAPQETSGNERIAGAGAPACAVTEKQLPSGLKSEVAAAYSMRCGASASDRSIANLYIVDIAGEGGGLDDAYITNSAWRARLNVKATCGAVEPLDFSADGDARALRCKLNAGGFPWGAFTVERGGQVYIVDGVPAALPAAAQEIAQRLDRVDTTDTVENVNRFATSLSSGATVTLADMNEMSRLLQRAGLANREYDFVTSARYYRDALALHERIFGAREDRGFEWYASRADLVAHLANELSNQTRTADADMLFARAEKLFENGVTPFMQAKFTTYKANHFANKGEREQALALAEEASRLRRVIAAPYLEEINSASDDTAIVIERDVAFGQASERMALADVATSENVVGRLLHRTGELDAALIAFERAEFALEKSRTRVVGEVNTALFRQLLYANWANALIDAGEPKKALVLLEKAATGAGPAAVGSRAEAMAYFAKGKALAAMGQRRRAAETATAGFAVLKELAAERKYAEVELERVNFYFDLLSDYAAASPNKARPYVENAFEHAQFVGETSITAEKLIETAFVLDKEGEDPSVRRAIDAFEKAKYQRRRAEIDLALMQSSEVVGDSTRLDPAYLASFVEGAERTLAQQDAAEAALRALFPEYFSLNATAVTVADLRSRLAGDEAIVRFLVGEEGTYAFALNRDDMHFYDVGMTREDIASVVYDLRQPFETNGTRPFDVAQSYNFYTQLLGPAEIITANARQLIVAPEASLMRLPFGVLVDAPHAADDPASGYQNVAFLARRYRLLTTPSPSAFAALRDTAPSAAPNPFMGFANAAPPTRQLRYTAGTTRSGGDSRCDDTVFTNQSFPALPETEHEAQSVAGLLGARDKFLFTQSDFTKSQFMDLEGDLRDYRVLYFATHGFLPHEFACGQAPGLLLSYEDGASAADLLLTAPEIMELDLDADLVVLSACNTAGGGIDPEKSKVGESLSGLVRAFFQSGARSVVATHWAVPSDQSKDLMIGAFEALSQTGGSFPEALKAAQTEMIEAGGETSHPFYWAAYTINGATPTVQRGLVLDSDPAAAAADILAAN